jgi:membrane protein
MWRLISDTFSKFWADECPRMAAALSFYTVFALPALLGFTILVAASVADRQQVMDRLRNHLHEAMTPDAARQVEQVVAQAQQPGWGTVAGLIGVAVLVVSASGALGELQSALNRAWGVRPDPQQSGYQALLWKRAISLLLLMGIGALLLASLLASWALATFSAWLAPHLPPWLSERAVWLLNAVVSLGLVTTLIAALFKYLPDVRLAWSDVWIGAAVTAVLFVAGKMALGLYFSTTAPASAYGAAGSLALVLLWIYYSAQVLLFGAEFTHVLSRSRGHQVAVEPGARRVAT